MKKLIAILLTVLLLVPTLALAASVDVTTLSDEELAQLAQRIVEEQRNRSVSNTEYLASGKIQGIHFVGLKSVEIVKDMMGKDAVNIVINYYHDDEANSYMPITSYMEIVTQGDEDLERTVVVGEKRANNSDGMRSLKKGELVELSSAYVLKDATKPVEIRFTPLGISFNPQPTDEITYTFQP